MEWFADKITALYNAPKKAKVICRDPRSKKLFTFTFVRLLRGYQSIEVIDENKKHWKIPVQTFVKIKK